jgi:surfeit locus 1 family protein
VKRKLWKESLIKELEEQVSRAAVELPDDLQDVDKMEYQTVRVRGHFLHDRELIMGMRSFIQKGESGGQGSLFSQQNGALGYHVVTPFKLQNRE